MQEDEESKNTGVEAKKQERKELAKQYRREVYQKAKQKQKEDPKFQERKLAMKEYRKAAYQKAKKQKQSSAKIAKDEKKKQLKSKVRSASELMDERPLATVYALADFKKKKRREAEE